MVNRENYSLIKAHLRDLCDIYQLAPQSVSRNWFYLRHFLLWADQNHFNKAVALRPTFPGYISAHRTDKGGGPLSSISQKKIMDSTRRFFKWAKDVHTSDFRGIPNSYINSLRPPRLPGKVAENIFVTAEEVIQLATYPIPESDLGLKRDQAAAAMLFLSGMRAGAFATLPINAVDIHKMTIKQWPEIGVKTKNGKCATTYLLPIPELLAVTKSWDDLVHDTLPPTARWYTPIDSHWGEQMLSTSEPGMNRNHAVSKRLKHLFEIAGLEYRSAHKFRHGHAVYGLQHAKTMADYKAVSMNLMHEDIKVTDQIYAPLLSNEVRQRVAGMLQSPTSQPDDELTAYLNSLSNAQLSKAMMVLANRLSK